MNLSKVKDDGPIELPDRPQVQHTIELPQGTTLTYFLSFFSLTHLPTDQFDQPADRMMAEIVEIEKTVGRNDCSRLTP